LLLTREEKGKELRANKVSKEKKRRQVGRLFDWERGRKRGEEFPTQRTVSKEGAGTEGTNGVQRVPARRGVGKTRCPGGQGRHSTGLIKNQPAPKGRKEVAMAGQRCQREAKKNVVKKEGYVADDLIQSYAYGRKKKIKGKKKKKKWKVGQATNSPYICAKKKTMDNSRAVTFPMEGECSLSRTREEETAKKKKKRGEGGIKKKFAGTKSGGTSRRPSIK